MFKTSSIILRIERIRDSKTRVIFFSREYGRITCWYNKKWFSWDIGDICDAYIDRYQWENQLKNIDIKDRINIRWQYASIIAFLEIIKTILLLLPEANPHMNIFDDYVFLIRKMRSSPEDMTHSHYILFQLRTLKHLGHIDGRLFAINPRLMYIDRNITSTPIKTILESKPLTTEENLFISSMNQKTVYQLQ